MKSVQVSDLPLQKDMGAAVHLIVMDTDKNEENGPGYQEGTPFTYEENATNLEQEKSDTTQKEYVIADRHSTERIFIYNGKSYCYSKEVFTDMLMMEDQAGEEVGQVIYMRKAIKETKPELLNYLSSIGKAHVGRAPMEAFSNYHGDSQGKKIVAIMKGLNYILHPDASAGFDRNYSTRCSIGIAVAAVLQVEGKRADLPGYQSDLIHQKIRTREPVQVWTSVLAVILFHNKKVAIPSLEPDKEEPIFLNNVLLGETSWSMGDAEQEIQCMPLLDSDQRKELANQDLEDPLEERAVNLTSPKVLEEIDLVTGLMLVAERILKSAQKILVKSRKRNEQEEDENPTEELCAEVEQVANLEKVLADLTRLKKLQKMLDSYVTVKKMTLAEHCSLDTSLTTWKVTKETLEMLMPKSGATLPMLQKKAALLFSEADQPPKISLTNMGLKRNTSPGKI